MLAMSDVPPAAGADTVKPNWTVGTRCACQRRRPIYTRPSRPRGRRCRHSDCPTAVDLVQGSRKNRNGWGVLTTPEMHMLRILRSRVVAVFVGVVIGGALAGGATYALSGGSSSTVYACVTRHGHVR